MVRINTKYSNKNTYGNLDKDQVNTIIDELLHPVDIALYTQSKCDLWNKIVKKEIENLPFEQLGYSNEKDNENNQKL